MATAAVAAVAARHGSIMRNPSAVAATGLDLDIESEDEGVGGGMAPGETHLSEQLPVWKRAGNGSWMPRQILLTKTDLLMCKDEDQKRHIVIDTIHLTDIASVEVVHRGAELEELEVELSRTHHDSSEMSSRQTASCETPRSPVLNINRKMSASLPRLSEDQSLGKVSLDGISVAPEDIIKVVTKDENGPKGVHSSGTKGKVYVFKLENEQTASTLVETTKQAAAAAVKEEIAKTRFEHLQLQARNVFNSSPVQCTVLSLIMLNFGANVLQAEMVPKEGSDLDRAFYVLDIILTACFTVELALNMMGHWFWDFWSDGWSVFDFIIVVASLVAVIGANIPGLSSLRVVRAFRALRIISQLKELRRIVNALAASLVPVVNALLIGAVVNCVFAVVAVQLFGETSPTHFGSFSLALFTMFVMSLYEHPFNKSDELVIYDYNTKEWNWAMVFFFGLFVLIEVWTLLQVMVAVLLDNFIQASTLDRKREMEIQWEKKMLAPHPLDPILEYLSTRFSSTSDLDFRLTNLFEKIDVDQSGTISYEEFRVGIKRIAGITPIHLSKDEFDAMVDDLQTSTGRHWVGEELELEQYIAMMRRQLKLYIQRTVANTTLTTSNSDNKTLLSAMKLTMLGEEKAVEKEGKASKESFQVEHLVRMVQELGQNMTDMDKRIRQIQEAVGLDSAAPLPNTPITNDRRRPSGGINGTTVLSEKATIVGSPKVVESDLIYVSPPVRHSQSRIADSVPAPTTGQNILSPENGLFPGHGTPAFYQDRGPHVEELRNLNSGEA